MVKDFATVTPNSGNGNGILSVTVGANSGAARSTIAVVSGGGYQSP